LRRFLYHLIDILDPDVQFNAGRFVSMADSLVEEIYRPGQDTGL